MTSRAESRTMAPAHLSKDRPLLPRAFGALLLALTFADQTFSLARLNFCAPRTPQRPNSGSARIRLRAERLDDDRFDEDEGWDEEESDESASSKTENKFGITGVQSDAPVVRQTLKADLLRQKIWEMPKNILPLVKPDIVRFPNKEKEMVEQELFVMKAKNANAIVKRSQAILKQGTLTAWTEKKMMRTGRKNFMKDYPEEQNRPGWRAFRYRSGMRDLRNEKGFRFQKLRLPDHKRKKRHRELRRAPARYIGSGKRYRTGTKLKHR